MLMAALVRARRLIEVLDKSVEAANKDKDDEQVELGKR